MNLEDEIRIALRRREPSPDFTDRVLSRASPARPQWVRWVAALAASLMLMAALAGYRHYQGERAKSQVLLALRITARQLNKAQHRVRMLNAAHRNNS
jgi:hypothetical protein